MNELPFIERNFHILNDDRFIMEKISLPVELQEGESIHDAINRTRNTIVENFKAAYPKVYTHLNFDEVRQVDSIEDFKLRNNVPYTIADMGHIGQVVPRQTEKINKGTIEEQIQACETLVELESFKIIADMNIKTKEAYNSKLEGFENGKLLNKK